MTTIFTRIIKGELPGTFVHRDDDVVVFMSINPISPGHALVVPIAEVDQWTDVEPRTRAKLFEVAHRVGEAQKRALFCNRVALIIAGFEVPHCHLHVIPANDMGDVSFANAAMKVDPDELRRLAEAIKSKFA
ncbi:MAG: HIT family protein [Ilumatobacteraceae bacterium]|nr:HIT family protein [Ilumatobacteraceae bacterium]